MVRGTRAVLVVTRIILLAHWVSDVVAGLAAGALLERGFRFLTGYGGAARTSGNPRSPAGQLLGRQQSRTAWDETTIRIYLGCQCLNGFFMTNVLDRRSRSLWKDMKVAPRAVRLHGDRTCDTIIVGSGIAGISTGYELALAGQKVIVIDRGPIAGGITAKTTAHLRHYSEDYRSPPK
jgi:hypothetical protein